MIVPDIKAGLGREAYDAPKPDQAVDFMCTGFELIKEPLNLEEGGQRWFRSVFDLHCSNERDVGLVLGATPWMIRLLHESGSRQVLAVDKSAAMLRFAESSLRNVSVQDVPRTRFQESDWMNIRHPAAAISVVLGDNSFSFLKFPDDWARLCDRLADGMRPNATLMTRFLCVPKWHRPLSMPEIAGKFMAQTSISYTEVRATLLFSHWSEKTAAIETERVLQYFESNRAVLEPLFQKYPLTDDNDLMTISKYKGAGAVYYAPAFADLLDVFEERFRIRAVHYGAYGMAEYFPLIVASRK